ncbi:MAG: NUDIX hydrolase [Candidatus Kerfeldbacteria bacterium CG08_land_8_20_14_0_20_40_16]|uniref:NUDIX hydrolase n=1 Tax=Candidatus Kerfeldbacteria bacterium CG08_land_8_20_14_0_20_40_16 TaxID=2014244 RepID=A0A2H0YW40_9BACT|nr:MAG: NUDIX hydrolase [Candidatus Kerfeldbacteria bacterium CG08_land_8_20_14_0_20_40_16]
MKSNDCTQFRFCPQCAGRLTAKKIDHLPRQVCKDCGFIFYQNSKPTASAIITDSKGQLLLVRRKMNPRKGYWDLPGGFLEEGENPINGLKREMKEELGIDIEISSQIGIYIDDYSGSYQSKTLNIAYEAKSPKGKITPMDDVNEVRWFLKTKIPWRKLAFPWLRAVLKDWLKK